MLKKLLILFIAIAPVAVVAQNVQIATVNSQEIIMAMPEISEIERQQADQMEQIRGTMQELEALYNRQVAEFMALPETTSDAIRSDRLREIQQIEERFQTFVQNSEQELQQTMMRLFEPVQRRVMEAIEAVAREGGYLFVKDLSSPSAIIFINDNAVDITPRVRARLGIR